MSENQTGVWPFKLLRRPVYKDWIFWLWLIALWASLAPIANSLTNDNSQEVNLVAGAIDFLIAFGIQSVVFLAVPSGIRNRIQRNRSIASIGGVTPTKKKKASSSYAKPRASTDEFDWLQNLVKPGQFDIYTKKFKLAHKDWLKDPSGHYDERFWDGKVWTRKVRQKSGTWKIEPSPSEMQGPSESAQEKFEEQTAGTLSSKLVADLEKLGNLFDRGLLTDVEFLEAKHRLLNS